MLDKLILGLLIVACLGSVGAAMYAQHEHGLNATLALSVTAAKSAQAQAEADRDAALATAAQADAQTKAIKASMSTQASDAGIAKTFVDQAKVKLAATRSDPATVKVLDMQIPDSVWSAIGNDSGK